MNIISERLKFLLLVLFLATFSSVSAQQVVTGTVTDAETGETLPGVTVKILDKNDGAITDIDGKYKLDVTQEDKLRFSYIGYQTQEVAVGNNTVLNIQLVPDTKQLEEIMIIGYGTTKKKDKTGATSKISTDDMNQGTLVDPIQAIQGKAAGVNITKQGGDPNAGFNIRIRGAAGFAAGGEPLYVVNGVRGVDPTTIASEDIISYDILKDAASTAIYGADGANGVIFITTKSGKEGEARVEYNAYIASDQIARKLDLLSANEYRNYIGENTDKYKDFQDNGGNVDWQDKIFRSGFSYNNNVAISGGSENSTYRASIANTNFEGVIKGSEKERTTGRIDLTQKMFEDKLEIKMGLSGTIEKNEYVNYGSNSHTDVLYQAFQRLPTDKVYGENNNYYETARVYNYYNPVASLEQIENTRNAKKYVGNIGLKYNINDKITATTDLSYLRNDDESAYFEPKYKNLYGNQNTLIRSGYGRKNYGNWAQKMLESTITYEDFINEDHHVTLLGGYSYRIQNWDGFRAQGREPISNQLGADNLQNFEDLKLGDISSYKGERKDIGFFGRAKYDFMSTYYITGMLRYDGSSVFGSDNRWGWFPSVQLGWNMANEAFMENSTFNLFKLRASWGISGNSNIDSYLYALRVGVTGTSIDPSTQKPINVLDYLNNPNPDLKWDENQEYNFGIDFSLLESRLSGSIEYYYKTVTDMLSIYDVPTETNFAGKIFYNGGEMENRGLEATLTGKIFSNEDFKWNSTLTYTRNTMEIVSLDGGKYDLDFRDVGYISAPGIVGVATQRMLPDEKLGTFYGFEYAGVSNGKWLVKGKDDQIYYLDDVAQSDEHKRVIGNALPDFEMGWSNYMNYKNFDISMSFRAVVGHEIYNATKQVFGNPDYISQRNVTDEALILNGHVSGAYQALSYYVEDASFLKLDNLSLGYTLPDNSINGISKIRIYGSVNNVFTLTNYDGIDPEVNFSGGNRGNGEIYFGIDQYNIYPKTRTFTLGLNIQF